MRKAKGPIILLLPYIIIIPKISGAIDRWKYLGVTKTPIEYENVPYATSINNVDKSAQKNDK
jgi:hypothetical protein